MPRIALCPMCVEKHEPPHGASCTRVLAKLAALQAEVLSLKQRVNLPPWETTRATTSTEQEDEDDEGSPAATHCAASLRGDAAFQDAATKRLQATAPRHYSMWMIVWELNEMTPRQLRHTQNSAVLSPLLVIKRHQISCALPPHAWNLSVLRLIPSPAPSVSLSIRSRKSWHWSAPGKAGHVLLNISYSPCSENCITCRIVWSQLAILSPGCLTRYTQPSIGDLLLLMLISHVICSCSQIFCPHIMVATWCNMSDSVRRIWHLKWMPD